MLVNIYHTTRRHILGNSITHTHRRENIESRNSKLKVKVKMFLYLIKYYAMKTYEGLEI
jgi:hypothetical protein